MAQRCNGSPSSASICDNVLCSGMCSDCSSSTHNFVSNENGENVSVIRLNNTKAGMGGLNVDLINAKINELSKGSKFYEYKLKQQTEVERKIRNMKEKLTDFSEIALRESETEMDEYGKQLESARDYSRFIVHIDMDAFFASVEMRDNPLLVEKPMAVGCDKMLSTSNYVARRFGVRAAMPGFIAKKLCPQLVIVPCNFEKYRTVSAQVQNILKHYDPEFCCMSLDEAYMDITSYADSTGDSPEKITQDIRSRIFEETKLTASAGIASNGFLAKICGDICKPNNQYYLAKTREAEENFVNSLPIRKVNGIGESMEHILQGLEIFTCQDIWTKRAAINLLFKPITAKWLIRIAKGYQDPWDAHHGDGDRKSISCERTLDTELQDLNSMFSVLEKLATEVAEELKCKHLRCKSVAVKIKTVEFVVKSKSCNLINFTSNAKDIFSSAKGLVQCFLREEKGLCLRLLGIRVTKWEKRDSSTTENDEPPCKQLKLQEAFAKVGTKHSYVCPVCSAGFSTERAVDSHLDICLLQEQEPSKKCSSHVNDLEANTTGKPEPKIYSSWKTFTCPICQNLVQSLVQNTEIASSDHVNYCISSGNLVNTSAEHSLTNSGQTWMLV